MSVFNVGAFQSARRGAFGTDLRWHAALGSTQDEARAALLSGAAQGTVVLAEEQRAGRGRWGRSWQAEAGSGLLFTVVLASGSSVAPATLPVALGIASVQALRSLGLSEASLKWPNDLWWRERKLGGLLVEQAGSFLLAGCGLNITQSETDWPDGLRGQAVSLRQAGLKASREAILAAVLGTWEAVLPVWSKGGLGSLRTELDAYDALLGRDCRVGLGRETVQGRVLGVASDGSLRLGLPDGGERRLQAAQAMELRPIWTD
jgi:BirA family transcriptional regulator, biotin operon repressor / biotin---[acetyl-CoA-carboxylase] ligase